MSLSQDQTSAFCLYRVQSVIELITHIAARRWVFAWFCSPSLMWAGIYHGHYLYVLGAWNTKCNVSRVGMHCRSYSFSTRYLPDVSASVSPTRAPRQILLPLAQRLEYHSMLISLPLWQLWRVFFPTRNLQPCFLHRVSWRLSTCFWIILPIIADSAPSPNPPLQPENPFEGQTFNRITYMKKTPSDRSADQAKEKAVPAAPTPPPVCPYDGTGLCCASPGDQGFHLMLSGCKSRTSIHWHITVLELFMIGPVPKEVHWQVFFS